MTTAKPLARYSAVNGALASGFATAELHHLSGHDRWKRRMGCLSSCERLAVENDRPPRRAAEAHQLSDKEGVPPQTYTKA